MYVMSGYCRWVLTCGCWMASVGLRWSQDRLQGLSSVLHLAAWGIPAAHTVTVLVQRDVDADELTGKFILIYRKNENINIKYKNNVITHK